VHPQHISIQDYQYELPESRIALHPLKKRDDSKLLIYKNGKIRETHFRNIVDSLPEQTLMLFNNTKVINARILFKKESGGSIEIFCLEPRNHVQSYHTAMEQVQGATWKCFVGNAAKWKNEILKKEIEIEGKNITLFAELLQKEGDAYIIKFSWQPPEIHFAAIIENAGLVPLPPYIKRKTELEDKSRYQTIFARNQGSVAAPTASLHFTTSIVSAFPRKKIKSSFVTLHVGAGTFKPVKSNTLETHEMHAEYLDVDRQTIEELLAAPGDIAVAGTTSLRTLETLYWLGVKAADDLHTSELELHQWEVYEAPLVNTKISARQSLQSLLQWMVLHNKNNLFTQTQLLIAPGYQFRLATILITNFHQPQSTLLLLVAAAVGPVWKDLYQYALDHNFRFLSYGDANLIFIDTKINNDD